MDKLDPTRVWVDGCFDFMHHGHSGAILQARRTIRPEDYTSRTELIIGIHNDNDIMLNKGGKPVMNEAERYEHTLTTRWCNQIVTNAPYVTNSKFLDNFGCKYVVHGDDITTDINGEDCYQSMKDMDRFKVVNRTEGVSTTELIHRILTGEKTGLANKISEYIHSLKMYSTNINGYDPWCWVFNQSFDHILVHGGYKFDKSQAIYVFGNFDLFHIGQIEKLKEVKNKNSDTSTLIVGIREGNEDCIMTLLERCLSVLSCRYVDGIIINPKIDNLTNTYELDHLYCPQGKFKYLNKDLIITRILDNKLHYVKRNKIKGK